MATSTTVGSFTSSRSASTSARRSAQNGYWSTPSAAAAATANTGVVPTTKRQSLPPLFPTFGDFLPQPFVPAVGGAGVNPGEKLLGEESMGSRSRSQDPPRRMMKAQEIGLGLSLGGTAYSTAMEESPSSSSSSASSSLSSQTSLTTTAFSFSPFDNKLDPYSPTSPTFNYSSPPAFFQNPLTPPLSRSGSTHTFPSGPSTGYSQPQPSLNTRSIPYYYTPPTLSRNLSYAEPFYPKTSSPTSASFPKNYPLSAKELEILARLHEGRIPTLDQLAPHSLRGEEGPSVSQPVVNTGNSGPMQVQAGDWQCRACTFVNWRRRVICMRCFPYAHDLGNILTINSHRAASLAASGSLNDPSTAAHQGRPPTPDSSPPHMRRAMSLGLPPVIQNQHPASSSAWAPPSHHPRQYYRHSPHQSLQLHPEHYEATNADVNIWNEEPYPPIGGVKHDQVQYSNQRPYGSGKNWSARKSTDNGPGYGGGVEGSDHVLVFRSSSSF